MLKLTRKEGDSIIIDGHIRITVVEIGDGRRVRLGIDAPDHVAVFREEVWQQLLNQDQRDRTT